MSTGVNPWDEHADAFGRFVARRERENLATDPIIAAMLDLLGDIAGQEMLDACCGEGFFARVLAERGARLIGVDRWPRLIEMAREKDPAGAIEFPQGDLGRPLPELEGRFGRIASHLALNDVQDYRRFAATLASLARADGRIVLAFNNPYSAVVRGHVADYFESGTLGVLRGMWSQGIEAHYYHRTLEDYLDAFLGAGLRLAKLVDVPDRAGLDWLLPAECRFPRFMVLAFDKP
jgi:SAM-dependent methyltransferase